MSEAKQKSDNVRTYSKFLCLNCLHTTERAYCELGRCPNCGKKKFDRKVLVPIETVEVITE